MLRDREEAGLGGDAMELEEGAAGGRLAKRPRANQVPRDRSSTARDAASLARSRSRSPSASGLLDTAAVIKVDKLARKKAAKLAKFGHAGESDRRIPTKRPKHLYSGDIKKLICV